ncbi:MAG: Gfo/Idh/MocA family oxidoreductase [Elusimicrobia bacterium]|nr:Gfo/Idh/MocA family oxidoreductase [Elusimicrobiota bacterium]
MSPLRLGLVGAGPWGRNYIRTLAQMGGAVLARVASRNPETPKLVPPSCAANANWRELIEAGDLDGLILAVPPKLHFEIASAALEAKLPVLVEKPLALDPRQAQDLLTKTRQGGAFVLVNHIHLFHPAYAALKAAASSLGPARLIQSAGGNRGPYRPGLPPLWDYAPHDLALCLDFAGRKPSDVAGRKEPGAGPGENWDIDLRFSGGLEAHIRAGNAFDRKERRFEVYFEGKALVMDDTTAQKLTRHGLENGRLGPGEPLPYASASPLLCALQTFIAGINSGSKDISSVQMGVEVVEVLAGIAR